MIGGPTGSGIEYYNKIKEDARTIRNLDFIGFVPHKEINRYYAESSGGQDGSLAYSIVKMD